MNEQKEQLETLLENIKDYITLRARIASLTIAENTANLLATLITNGIVILFILLFCIFGSVALALWIGKELQNHALGFVIVAGIYLILVLIFILIKDKYLKKPLTNTVVKNLFKSSSYDKVDNQN
ncbi:phage holin family protein [Solitalea lacus]|uniref:phage holin family protein n=1 Tax=Solitalea lacus TaxID=2911172 RepID=UPI001EDA8F2E|nr:phage holin family protein [Solitalea lacus]UKJ07878.1 phage holin family protein [Solitalea lacus]